MAEHTKGPDFVLCAQALDSLTDGSFFSDYDWDMMLLGELRKLYDVHFEGRTTIETAAPDMYEALKEVRECCLFADDDGGIGISEDVVIPSEMFDKICLIIKKAEGSK